MKIYVASSWRNQYQPAVVQSLQLCGHEVVDFKNPAPGVSGFGWQQCGVEQGPEESAVAVFNRRLATPRAQEGFKHDRDAMIWADACVLVLPSGKSAHLEAGWFAGQGKQVIVFIPEGEAVEPELMYLLGGDCVRESMMEVLTLLAQREPVKRVLHLSPFSAAIAAPLSMCSCGHPHSNHWIGGCNGLLEDGGSGCVCTRFYPVPDKDEPIPGWREALRAVAKHAEGLTRKWPLKSGQYITPAELRSLATHPGSLLSDRVRNAISPTSTPKKSDK